MNTPKPAQILCHSAFTESQNDYRFAKWQMAVMALALAIVLIAVWYGIRHSLLNPLGRVIAHIREIASGDLTKTLTPSPGVKSPNWLTA